MSVPARKWALSKRTGSSARRAVLNCLADWMIGDDAIECWPSVETIAFTTELNRQTVMKAAAELVALGFVSKKRQCENLKWKTVYSFIGYVPSEWINAEWPEPSREGTKNRTIGKPYLQELGRTKSRTDEGTKNRTNGGTKNRTDEGTKNRTRTRRELEEIRRELEETGITTSLCSSNEKALERPKETALCNASRLMLNEAPPFDDDLFDEAIRVVETEAAPESPPEKKQKPRKARTSVAAVERPNDLPEQLWQDWLALRKAKRAPLNTTTINTFRAEAQKAGISFEEAVSFSVANGYQGFKADWYRKNASTFTNDRPHQGYAGFGARNTAEIDYNYGLPVRGAVG